MTLNDKIAMVENAYEVDMTDVELRVEQWAIDRKILKAHPEDSRISTWDQANLGGQLRKLREELIELETAVDAGDDAEIIDAIGDMTVVLTMIANGEGVSLNACYQSAYEVIKDRKGEMRNGVFVKEEDLHKDIEAARKPEPDHVYRMRREYDENYVRYRKLWAFVYGGGPFQELPEEDQLLLREQAVAMDSYLSILGKRLVIEEEKLAG